MIRHVSCMRRYCRYIDTTAGDAVLKLLLFGGRYILRGLAVMGGYMPDVIIETQIQQRLGATSEEARHFATLPQSSWNRDTALDARTSEYIAAHANNVFG